VKLPQLPHTSPRPVAQLGKHGTVLPSSYVFYAQQTPPMWFFLVCSPEQAILLNVGIVKALITHSVMSSQYFMLLPMMFSVGLVTRGLWRKASSGMLRRAALVRTDVSEELSASIIRVTTIGELGTFAITSNRRTHSHTAWHPRRRHSS
jgi:hypothetical protein